MNRSIETPSPRGAPQGSCRRPPRGRPDRGVRTLVIGAALLALSLVPAGQAHAQTFCTTPAECDDGLVCTIDQCVGGQCQNQPVPGCCDDVGDCVTPGQCQLTAGATCSNGRCVYPRAPTGTACNDRDLCTRDDECTATGFCEGIQTDSCEIVVTSNADQVDAAPGDGMCATAAGDCTLRAAIQEANALPGFDTIALEAGFYALTRPGAGEDASATGDLDVSEALRIVGEGADSTIVDGGNLDRVLHTLAAAVATDVSGVTISGGNASLGGGGIFHNGSSLTLTDVVIRDNIGPLGGGLHNARSATLEDVIVSNNRATATGGQGGGIYSSGALRATDTIITDNAARDGGGVSSSAALTFINASITRNSAITQGGGIRSLGTLSTLSMERGILLGNSATDGGGIYHSNSNSTTGFISLTLANVTLGRNAASSGAALWSAVATTGGARLTHVTIADNAGVAIRRNDTPRIWIANSIIADTVSAANCNGPLTSQGHNIDSGSSCGFTQPTDKSDTDPLLGPLSQCGDLDYFPLLPDSPAIDAASAVCPPPGIDQCGSPRPRDGDGDGTRVCDVGASELGPQCGNGFVSPPEECDPIASPTGCNEGEVCEPDCTCAVCERPCPGDCDGSGHCHIGEVILAVRCFLGEPVTCAAADADCDGHCSMGEVVKAVVCFLEGCPQP